MAAVATVHVGTAFCTGSFCGDSEMVLACCFLDVFPLSFIFCHGCSIWVLLALAWLCLCTGLIFGSIALL